MFLQRNTPGSHTNFFKYQPEKIEVGTLYQYSKSNLDGSNPALISIYIASKNHIEVLKTDQNNEILEYLTSQMNWTLFCPDYLLSWQITPDGSMKLQTLASLTRMDHTFVMWVRDAEFKSKVAHYPVYHDTCDFTGLNFAFRHLINPYESFEIGIVETNLDRFANHEYDPKENTTDLLRYRGKVKVNYIGDDLYQYHL